MRTPAVALLFLALALPARASMPVTVAQLEQTLTAARTQPDAKLADELSALKLTQRLSPPTLARLQSQLPGPQSQQELSILAAQSSFLDLPPSEIPSTPAPDLAQQRQIMSLVVTYVTQTINRLPNFIATRETRSFADRPAGAYSALPLHFTGQTSASVIYRDGQERDTNSKGKKIDTSAAGLVSWGEFGPILTTVLLDAAKSQLGWSHWEQGAGGPVAVFRYAVPAKKSQYQVQMCGMDPNCSGALTGYHGEITVDPTSGAILRLTVVADIEPGSTLDYTTGLSSGSIMVEYGPVDIGGKSYICPLHSAAIAQVRAPRLQNGVLPAEAMDHSPKRTLLNEVTFTRYHIYRSESHILTGAELAQMNGEPAGSTGNGPTPPSESAPAGEPAQNTAETASPAASATAQAAPAASSTNSANAASSANSANIPVFHATARQVLVDVVVDKRNGDPVPSLPQSDFSIEEDGKPQTIDFFEEHSADSSAPVAQPAMPPLPPGAVSNVPAAPPAAAVYVFLLDSLNTEPQDQVFIRQQVLSFLHQLDPGTHVAIFTLGSNLRLLQGFTSDPATLLAAVSGNKAKRDAMAQTRSDDADDAAHIQNLQTMQAGAAGIEGLKAADANAHNYTYGARISMTFEALSALARYLEGVPGRKNLVWFASSFPVVFFPTPSEIKQLRNSPGYLNHVQQTANLFTLSKIAVYPVSGAGVMNSNIGLADSAGPGRANGNITTAQMAGEALNDASAFANMEELASSTGGRAFTTNDIGSALHKIVHDSDVYYTVGYAPTDSDEDGGFRRIAVKVAGGKYKLAYRQGYNASEPGTAPAENPISPLLQLGIPNATGIYYGASLTQVRAPQVSTLRPGNEQPSSETTPAGQNLQLKGPLTRYTVAFTIRAQDLSFGQAPSGERIAKLLLAVKAYGADGAALNWQATQEAVELSAAQYQSILKSGIPVTLSLDLPANTTAQLVTAVYDWNTARSGTLEMPVRP